MRINERDLDAVMKRINEITGSPTEAYTRTESGYKANVGCYTLSGAYGGWQLQRIMNESGGVENVLGAGYLPKRELYGMMQAFLKGIAFD